MTAAAAGPDTLADVLRALGDLPPARVLWRPYPGTATEADLLHTRGYELIDGLLVQKVLGFRNGLVEVAIGCRLLEYVRRTNSDGVTMATGPFRVRPGVVRLPDVAYIGWGRLLGRDRRIPDIAPAGPDIGIEILMPDSLPRELQIKRREYFAAGTKLVWEIHPDARTVAVYTGPDTATTRTAADTLDGGTVLPGFTLPLAELLNNPQLNPRPY